MFEFLKRKETPKPEKRQSLFSTDIPVPESNSTLWEDIFARSFQKNAGQMQPRNAFGQTVSGTDAALTIVPTNDAIGTFAMDSPTEGNPTSLKPIINPIDSLPYVQLAWYASQGFIGYQVCAMISQHWLIDKALTMPARDAMRHGFEIGASDGQQIDTEILAYIKKRDKQFAIKKNCVELVRFNRMFGIRIALPVIDTDDTKFYQKPFNIDGVKPNSYRGISQIDPYWITPELDFSAGANPASIHFYEPTWWRVNGKRIHRSHLIVIRNGQVADVLKPSYLYGGIPVPQKIAERVYAAERTANEAPQLALTKRTSVWKMDMMQALANQAAFEQKMAWFAATRDNYGIKAIGLDDEVEQLDTTLTDFDQTIMTQYQIVAAAADVPVSKLMGESPKGGLGANGDYESDSYHEFLESIQTNDMQPLIERHHQLLMRSEVLPKFGKEFEIDVIWNATDTPNAKELAEINAIKANTAKTLVDSGAVDGMDVRQQLILDKESGYNGLEEIPDDELADPDYVPITNRRESERIDESIEPEKT